jgi:phage terminase large subunit GpA-like protein
VTDLAIADGSPGQCYFALNTPKDAFDEFFNETEQEGKWVRSGPNESLDCYAYAEAGRILLEPDRKDRLWRDPAKRPIWARPIDLSPDEPDEAPEAPRPATPKPAKRSILDRFDQLNAGRR